MDETIELTRQFRSDLGQSTVEHPEPPFQVRNTQLIYLMCEFERDVLRALLPPELEPAPTNTGVFCICSTPNGWGIAPYAGGFAGINVLGFDTPQGNYATYIHTGFYSGVAGRIFNERYNKFICGGWSNQTWKDDVARGEAGIGNETFFRLEAKLPPEAGPPISGINNYLGSSRDGGINFYSVAISTRVFKAETFCIDVLSGAPEKLLLFKPKRYVHGLCIADMAMTYSPPRLITESPERAGADARRVVLLDAFSRLGRAAAIVTSSGSVVHANGEAEGLLPKGMMVPGRRIALQDLRSQTEVGDLISRVGGRSGGQYPEYIGITLPNRGPILVQAFALDEAVAQQSSVLLMFTDPSQPLKGNTGPALQLLGLTAAEARIAAQVGLGRSAAEAASDLGITANTARSQLKTAYDKLGINKQTQLAALIAKLEGSLPALS